MSRSPQDVYARLLSSPRGYPLWTPEPSNELLIQRSDGLKIGDVGVILDDGGFDVFFNICLPSDHPFHTRHGVPNGFIFIHPDQLEIRTLENAEYAGRIISTPSVRQIGTIDPSSDSPQSGEPSVQAYRFNLSSDEGALLILPKGAVRYELKNLGLFQEQARRNGAEWYNYAVNRRQRIIDHDSLYLITGFHKAHCWSAATFENRVGSENHTAHFKRTQGYDVQPAYSWEATCALDWRVGPLRENDFPDQAVFIRGLKIALRSRILGDYRISVEADFPSTRHAHERLSSIVPSNSRFLSSLARSFRGDIGNSIPRLTTRNSGMTNPTDEQPQSDASIDTEYDGLHVEIHQVPDVLAPFHPADAINQYLLRKEPSANIAITDDGLWMEMLRDGLLTLEELEQGSRFGEVLSSNYHIISEEGAIRLERKGDSNVLHNNKPLNLSGETSMKGDIPGSSDQDNQNTRTVHSEKSTRGTFLTFIGPNDKPSEIISVKEEPSLQPRPPPYSLSYLYPTLQDFDIQIDDTVLTLWSSNRLQEADVLLTSVIGHHQNPHYGILASRALLRTRLQMWDAALVDAEQAIKDKPSAGAYIAKSIAHLGKGERDRAYRTCDIAFMHIYPSHCVFLLLIKAIVVSMACEYDDAISRMDDLIAVVDNNPTYYVTQAYMYFLLGSLDMDHHRYESAVQCFQRAQVQMRSCPNRSLSLISLITGWNFDGLDVLVEQRLCEAFYMAGHTLDAVEHLNEMKTKLGDKTSGLREWMLAFIERCSGALSHLGDTAAHNQEYDRAIAHYTAALSLKPRSPQDIFLKRSKIFITAGSWTRALDDANQVITLDPSSPWGYETKHAALHGKGSYLDAVIAFEGMLSRMEQSPDPDIRRLRHGYTTPSEIRKSIRKVAYRTLRHSPHVLIDTSTGRLCDRANRASAFASLPIFNELVSSMTMHIDRARIKHEVRQYFRYAMLSHTWEANEPLYHQTIAVYKLDRSPTHVKLQTFCKIVRDFGYHWAWSDTCCINRLDDLALQEALVAMFEWYRGAALVIVFLRGVHTNSQRGALARSIWNTCAWTLQEYIAAPVVRFYTEDWTPYLNLQVSNHKEAEEVILEMAEATGVSSQRLSSLHPGLSDIREKLYIASTRKTMYMEDAAYSLLGILSVADFPIIYGERESALGRLLSQVLSMSGDTGILAWTGESSSFNSCLPENITAYNEPATTLLPELIPESKTKSLISATHPSLDLNTALTLYDRLNELPSPVFIATRMKLPCIAFPLPPLSSSRTRVSHVYHAKTAAFGMVEIRTRQDLPWRQNLYLLHPWLDAILGRERKQSGGNVVSPDSDEEENSAGEIDEPQDSAPVPVSKLTSYPAPLGTVALLDKEAQARWFIARLREPFGALLVTQTSEPSETYRRITADSSISVQIQENVSLDDILDNVRVLDIL